MPKISLISLLVSMHFLSLSAAYADATAPLSAPEDVPSISALYSDVDMRVRLAVKPDAAPCAAESCNFNQEFDARVQRLGTQLSASAYTVYPTIKKRVKQFTFGVVDKKDAGTASNGAGKVVLFRGIQHLELSDDALSFVMAREMGHVIGDHHATNTYTKLAISALATVMFPALGIIGASSAAAQATTATTLLTGAATTATSMLGSEVAMARMKPMQLAEADEIAHHLMNHQGWDLRSVTSVLQFDDADSANLDSANPDSASPKNGWLQDLQMSEVQLQRLVADEELAIVPLEDSNLVAEAAPIVKESSVKIGFEDFDLTKDMNDAAQSLPMNEATAEAEIEPVADAGADAEVIVEALNIEK